MKDGYDVDPLGAGSIPSDAGSEPYFLDVNVYNDHLTVTGAPLIVQDNDEDDSMSVDL